MSYVRDNGLARARRRRERRSLAILVLCGLLVLGAIVFATTFMSKPSGTADCPNGTVSVPPPPQATFSLNVYNAGGQKGAASSVADTLSTHRFKLGVIGNDPYKKTIMGPGEIRFGPAGAKNAREYVAKVVPGATLVQDGRDGTSVDVVVGPAFPKIKSLPPVPSTKPACK